MAGSSSSTASPSGVQGICPSGWRVPSDAEWQALEVSVGMSAATAATSGSRGTTEGTKLKANSSLWNLWSSSGSGIWNSGNGTDDYGFSVLPAGRRNNGGAFNDLGNFALFWSSSEDDASSAWCRYFFNSDARVYRNLDNDGSVGFSLRCLQN